MAETRGLNDAKMQLSLASIMGGRRRGSKEAKNLAGRLAPGIGLTNSREGRPLTRELGPEFIRSLREFANLGVVQGS